MGVRAGGSFYGEVPCEGAGNGSGGVHVWRYSMDHGIDRSPLNRMTDMTENITSLQLRWRVVKILELLEPNSNRNCNRIILSLNGP